MKWCFFVLFIAVCASSVCAAKIYGTVYDLSLDEKENVIVEINTEPKQQLISKDGKYAFEVPAGKYLIEANYYIGGVLESTAKEEVNVRDEGNFIMDLILFPAMDDLTLDIDLEDDYFERRNYSLWIFGGAVIVGLLLIWYVLKMKKISLIEEDDYYNKVLSIIKENKRITQKEIRKQIPLSEAKISLIISELEHKGIVEKIKKGRGNILILK